MIQHGPTYLYAGEGAWNISVDQTQDMLEKRLDSRSISRVSSLDCVDKKTRFVVIPGGNAPYMSSFHGLTREKVSSYVEEGGRILGICAGAILLTDEIVSKPQVVEGFSAQDELIQLLKKGRLYRGEINQKTEGFGISIYPGKCVAPHIVNDYKDPKDLSNLCAVDVVTEEKVVFKAFHYSGPAFLNTPTQANILLRYQMPLNIQEMGFQFSLTTPKYWLAEGRMFDESPVAAISYPYGNGQIVLSGVHPEMNPNTFSQTAEKHKFEGKLPEDLQESNDNREAFINKIFTELKLK